MDGKDFAQWEPLTHHIVRNYFLWAYDTNRSTRGCKRPIDYDDLVQEGHIALIYAWKHHDPTRSDAATFKTYAFRAIYRRVAKFIEQNVTPVTARNWRSRMAKEIIENEISKCYNEVYKLSTAESDKLSAAISCILFSESTLTGDNHREDIPRGFGAEIEDTHDCSDTSDVLHGSWVDHCIEVLKRGLTPREFSMIRARAAGQTYGMIGKRHKIKREIARRAVGEIMIKAAVLLIDQEEKLNDK